MPEFFRLTDIGAIVPELELAVFGMFLLIFDLLVENKRRLGYVALAGIAISGFFLFRLRVIHDGVSAYGGVLALDPFSIFFKWIFLIAAALSIALSLRYLDVERENHGEYYALVLFATMGMMFMAGAVDLVTLYIGLETMAIATYVLVGFLRSNQRSNEASLKYFLLGAFSSAILLYGMSLLYGISGSTRFVDIAEALSRRSLTDPISLMAMITLSAGLFFKIAAVPFHQWAPDAYEGAPTSITGFMSVSVKAAGWAMLLHIFMMMFPLRPAYVPFLVFVSIATMTGANFAALTQSNLKRLLAYSSIAHVGYMLLGLVAGSNDSFSPDGIKGILIYLLVYTFMNLGAFAVITSLRHRNVIGDEIDDIAGLYSRAPVEAVLMLLFLLSLAGIPPLAGFWGKYFIFLSLIETGHYTLAALAVLYSVFGLYYYLRIANAMFMREPLEKESLPLSPAMGVALAITAFATLIIGIFPNPMIKVVNGVLGLTQVTPVANLLR